MLFRAFNYAKNVSGNRSHKLALMSVRCVLGKVQKLSKEEHGRLKPNKGYDSVRLLLLCIMMHKMANGLNTFHRWKARPRTDRRNWSSTMQTQSAPHISS